MKTKILNSLSGDFVKNEKTEEFENLLRKQNLWYDDFQIFYDSVKHWYSLVLSLSRNNGYVILVDGNWMSNFFHEEKNWIISKMKTYLEVLNDCVGIRKFFGIFSQAVSLGFDYEKNGAKITNCFDEETFALLCCDCKIYLINHFCMTVSAGKFDVFKNYVKDGLVSIFIYSDFWNGYNPKTGCSHYTYFDENEICCFSGDLHLAPEVSDRQYFRLDNTVEENKCTEICYIKERVTSSEREDEDVYAFIGCVVDSNGCVVFIFA